MASPTITLVTAAPNPAVNGQSVTLTATVIPVAAGTPTGTVTFVVSGGPTLTGTLSGGTASVTASGLTVGTHIVTATYNGDANFASSTGTTAVVVIQAATTTSVTSAPDPSTLGQPVTFTATVTPVAPGAGVPSGTVTFTISGSGGGTFTQPLSSLGTATLSFSTLGVGAHTVVAVYSGDAGFLPSTGTDTHTVAPGPAATTTTLMSSVNPSVFGQPVTFTATVTPNAPATGVPTGTVTFVISGSGGGSFTQPLSGGTATFTTSGLDAGSHTVTANYSGDANFAASSSATLTQVVNLAVSRTSMSSNPNPAPEGSEIDFVAFVEGFPPGDDIPTGTVTFTLTDGATTITAEQTVDALGFAFLTVGLEAGEWDVSAVYSGDANFGSSGVSQYTQIVTGAQATTTP
ncbi:Ig-like domain-containing protein [Streptomyces javensis]|uniref:Ig-like domain-containing protein n=1 Tax=Streptomyces javensis TaxID=114698 RepID=UPI0033E576C1